MKRASLRFVAGLTTIAMAVIAAAQTAQKPAFEVASVKRSKSADPGGRLQIEPGGRFNADNATVRQLIARAYQIQDAQIVGAPEWTKSERFDIAAKAERNPTAEELATMLKSLLMDRFQLRAHPSTQDQPVYALVLARKDGKFGPRLRRSDVDCDKIAAEAFALRNGAPPEVRAGDSPPCSIGFSGAGQMSARSKLMSQLLTFFSQVTQRRVVDRTGLEGTFDVDLTWTPSPVSLAGSPDTQSANLDGPSIFTAVQEQLGLTLEPAKIPGEVLVIDSIALPTEN